MKLKKVAAAGLAVCMAAQVLTGCGGSTGEESKGSSAESTTAGAAEATGSAGAEVKKEGLPIVDETQTLKVLTITQHPEVEPSQVVIQHEIENETNVKIEWTIIPQSAYGRII